MYECDITIAPDSTAHHHDSTVRVAWCVVGRHMEKYGADTLGCNGVRVEMTASTGGKGWQREAKGAKAAVSTRIVDKPAVQPTAVRYLTACNGCLTG